LYTEYRLRTWVLNETPSQHEFSERNIYCVQLVGKRKFVKFSFYKNNITCKKLKKMAKKVKTGFLED